MRRALPFTLILTLVLFLAACGAAEGPPGPVGPAGAPGPVGPPGPPGENATAFREYVGSERCGDCHEEIYATFVDSAHPNVLTPIEGGEAPVFPRDEQTGGLESPPEGYAWSDISYVVGGYSHKALFLDGDGYLIAGGEGETTQYNFALERIEAPAGWAPFHAGEGRLEYDCGECHTTGYQPQGNQGGLEGIAGTWAFAGVQCEACHGPGSLHATNPQGIEMTVERSAWLCADCHANAEQATVAADGDFQRHEQQFSALFNSRHLALDCIACHDPHASPGGAEAAEGAEGEGATSEAAARCESCHWQKTVSKNSRHGNLDCIDCHMAPMVRAAQADPELHIADMRSHLFSINPDPAAPQFSDDGERLMPYITLTYACQQCHNNEFAVDRDMEELAEMARGYHSLPTPTPTPSPEPTATPEGEGDGDAGATPTPEATASP